MDSGEVVTLRIKDIPLSDVKAGKNWRFYPPHDDDWLELPMEDWGPVIEADDFTENDEILYSGLLAYPSGDVIPVLMLKTVGDAGYWGDSCEFVKGRWQQIGLEPNPNAPLGQEYIANPLASDPSFDAPDHDYRTWHRNGFLEHLHRLPEDR